MTSHPNYRGYDATIGKVTSLGMAVKEHSELAEQVSPIGREDMPSGTPQSWRPLLEKVRKYCADGGMRFAMSPFPYQIAKIYGDGFVIVLWRSRFKKSRQLHIKPAFEGAAFGAGANLTMLEITAMVEASRRLL